MKPSIVASPERDANLAALLEQQSRSGFSGRRRWLIVGAGLCVAVGLSLLVLLPGDRATELRFVTETAAAGDLVVKVSATGTLQPTNRVDVSSELSGIVAEVLVDENDRVSKGQVLAQLDLSRLRDAVTKSQAALAASEAQVQQAQATVDEARAQLARFEQVAQLSGGKVPSQSEMATAAANKQRAEANLASARASVTQARANLQSDGTNLDKSKIRSPIDGVVLTRAVEPGQTVAAALQAPVLFALAEDLTKMKLQVDVDEADVGQVQVGQDATFTVDAWPGRTFTGVITRVGYGSQTKDNVVTYPTVLAVNNDDLSLRPGMTASADIITAKRENVLLVPNAALRFRPAMGGPPGGGPPGGFVGKLLPRPPMRMPGTQPRGGRDASPQVWTERDGQAVPIEVQIGASDGQVTEVLGGELTAGTRVITQAASTAP